MPNERKRVVGFRLIVLVHVDVTHDDFLAALRAVKGPAVAVVIAEVASNLESVAYVESATVHQL